MELTEEQRRRYARHLDLPGIGETGQEKLLLSRVLLVGTGGLASAAGFYLAAAGVGTLALIDDDIVDISNLQRQIAHTTERIGEPKVLSARKAFEAINPDVRVLPIRKRFRQHEAGMMADFDAVLDCSDNYETRFLVNDSCLRYGTPLIIGAVSGFEGQLMVVLPGQGPCYRCIFADAPPSAFRDRGPLGAVPGVIGSLQAVEAIKLLCGIEQTSRGELLVYDGLRTTCRKVPIRRDKDCPACGPCDGSDTSSAAF
jgi:sulfur-carrier protein adenylyltransferase/sulfurtransferase